MSSKLYYDVINTSLLVTYLQGLVFSMERTIEKVTVEILESAKKDILFSMNQDKETRKIRLIKKLFNSYRKPLIVEYIYY